MVMNSVTDNKSSLFAIGEIGEVLGADLEGAPEFRRVMINGVKIDSRVIEDGDLFVAIKGENYDGHDFVVSALNKGAAAVVVSNTLASNFEAFDAKIIAVNNTVYALGELAKYYRGKMPANIIAVTGSNGKTTAKNMIYEIISKSALSLKSKGNYNNLFGLPLSIFQLRKNHKHAVFELGMSEKGEISRLGEIACPDIAVITNVGPVHLEYFESVEEIASAKLEILEHLKLTGTLILNGDDELLFGAGKEREFETIKFGMSFNNDIHPTDLKFDGNQLGSFKINSAQFNLSLPGVHNVYNALAAYAVSKAVGLDPASIADALMNFKPSGMRSEIVNKGGVSFFLDCYNANPISMKYAIDSLSQMQIKGRRIAVLGDMLELGGSSEAYHKQIGKHARESGIKHLFAFGKYAASIAEAFGEGGRYFSDKSELLKELMNLIEKGDLVLLKASRDMALEEIAESIMELI